MTLTGHFTCSIIRQQQQQRPFNGLWIRDNLGRTVPEETFTHSHPSGSSCFLYHLSPFATIHGILFIQLTCLTVLTYNLFAGLPLGLKPSTSCSIHFGWMKETKICTYVCWRRNLHAPVFIVHTVRLMQRSGCSHPTSVKKYLTLSVLHTFNGPLSRTTRVSRYQKCKTNLDFIEARDSEWQWNPLGRMQVCTSLQADNPTTQFFTGRMPFLLPNQQHQSTEGTDTFCKYNKIGWGTFCENLLIN